VFFTGHDGGVWKSADHSESFTDLSDGLEVLQIYKIALSQSDESVAICGVQDQFAMYMHDDTWHCLRTGESGENLIDYNDPNTFYVSGYGGGFRRTRNGGSTFVYINPPGVGAYVWLWPYVMHPSNPNTIYIATNNIYKSTDQGDSWTTLASNLAGTQLSHLELAPSNPNIMLAGTYNQLWKSTMGGLSWTNISANLPYGTISDICISSSNHDHMWLTMSGFTHNRKVYQSIDGGLTWENISLNLPNLPANCIVHEKGSDEGVYVGMDVGVFYKNNDLEEWVDFSDGLPNVIVNELEIQHDAEKIRAGTYGRGFWESDLYRTGVSVNNTQIQKLKIHPNPSTGLIHLSMMVRSGDREGNLNFRDITGKILFSQSFTMESESIDMELDLSAQAPGIYFLETIVGNTKINKKIVRF